MDLHRNKKYLYRTTHIKKMVYSICTCTSEHLREAFSISANSLLCSQQTEFVYSASSVPATYQTSKWANGNGLYCQSGFKLPLVSITTTVNQC